MSDRHEGAEVQRDAGGSADERASSGTVQGVVVVVRRGEEFLMIKRAEGILVGGAWCFVGGSIERGESQEEAAVREFREEVGGAVRPLRKIWEYTRPDGKLLLHWWLAEMDGGRLTADPAEVAEIRWCDPDEIEALPRLLESNREFMREVGRSLVEQTD